MISKIVSYKIPIIILMILTIGFLGAGIGIGISNIINLSASTKVVGTIIDCSHEEKTLVEFVINGQFYRQYINSSSSLYYIGKEIELFYSYKTNLVYLNGFIYLLPIMFTLFGLLFLTTAIIMLFYEINTKKILMNKHEYIKKTAKVVGIIQNRKYSYNNVYPNQLQCTVRFEGNQLNIKSPSFWDKLLYEEKYVVDVYFKNQKKYVVDLKSYRKDELFYEMDV